MARAGASRLILVDQAESPLYEIERELAGRAQFPASAGEIADVRNREKLRQIFDRYRPHRLPRRRLQARADAGGEPNRRRPQQRARDEDAEVAVEFEAKRFVLISTDKALIAQAVYGQSKALCEWIVSLRLARGRLHPLLRGALRNVLESAGSA